MSQKPAREVIAERYWRWFMGALVDPSWEYEDVDAEVRRGHLGIADFVELETRRMRDLARREADEVRLDAERIRIKLEGPTNREAACYQTGRIAAADEIESLILRAWDNALERSNDATTVEARRK